MIPKALHFVWIGPTMPRWAWENVRLFRELNPTYPVHIHGEECLLGCFQQAYNNIEGPHLYARKSDLIRVSALVRFGGGWYWDTDFLPIRPIDELYERYRSFPRGMFLTHCDYLRDRKWIANGIIGADANSTFFKLLVERLKGLTSHPQRQEWALYGPRLYTELSEERAGNLHMGELDDYYRILDRQKVQTAYRRIMEAGYTPEAIARELGEPLPYALHMGMQDELTLK